MLHYNSLDVNCEERINISQFHSSQKRFNFKNINGVEKFINQKSFICQICKKGFSRKDSLKVHYRIHTGDGLFICSVCNKACTTKQELRRHFRTHSGERPFKCQYCNYSASLKVNLKKHMITHSKMM